MPRKGVVNYITHKAFSHDVVRKSILPGIQRLVCELQNPQRRRGKRLLRPWVVLNWPLKHHRKLKQPLAMAEGDNKSANVLAQETAQLEEQLQGWGEVILAGDQVLRWKKPWFPGALMAATTLVFMMIYYLDPSVLTGLSCTVMLLCLSDYLVPTLAPRIFGSNKWSSEQQQRFHEICGNLVKTQRRILGWWKRLFSLKEEKPKMYFASVISSLVTVAWMGQQVHNLFLTYLIVSFLLLLPGLNQHGVISKYAGMAKREINKLLKQKEKKNE
uniref:ADP-ribosylation factor-like 6 interacting protein 1 n=4 Tax=Oncorhynchus TaxID=8016 RepID=A0A8C7SRM7_ONCMY